MEGSPRLLPIAPISSFEFPRIAPLNSSVIEEAGVLFVGATMESNLDITLSISTATLPLILRAFR